MVHLCGHLLLERLPLYPITTLVPPDVFLEQLQLGFEIISLLAGKFRQILDCDPVQASFAVECWRERSSRKVNSVKVGSLLVQLKPRVVEVKQEAVSNAFSEPNLLGEVAKDGTVDGVVPPPDPGVAVPKTAILRGGDGTGRQPPVDIDMHCWERAKAARARGEGGRGTGIARFNFTRSIWSVVANPSRTDPSLQSESHIASIITSQ